MEPEPAHATSVPAGARCANHPDMDAAATCTRCGSYMCPACRPSPRETLCRACWDLVAAERHWGDASRGQRFLNFVVDSLALAALRVVLVAVPGVELPDAASVQFALAYYVVMEASLGVTVGKLATGTRVVDGEGGRPGVVRILGRTLIRYVPFEALSFVLADRGWHDAWSETRVVRTRPPKHADV